MIERYSIIDAPSILGLFPQGVEDLSKAILANDLTSKLAADVTNRIPSLAYSDVRDSETGFLNGPAAQAYAYAIATAVKNELDQKRVPVILGGDCSILHGALVALKRRGRFGLLYLDGHADFFNAKESPTGEIADMGLAIAVGRNHALMDDIDGLKPYVRPEDAVLFGYRDEQISLEVGMQPVRGTGVNCFDLQSIRDAGFDTALATALQPLAKPEIDGIFVHFDADVLDDAVMPAVDYRLDSGLAFKEVAEAVRAVRRLGKLAGLTLTIFNPRLDPDGSIGRALTSCLISALRDEV